jgi:hypothetical protein
MIRPLAFSLATFALSAAALCRADETFPVVHSEPITIRILSGKNGLPLSNLHLLLVGGYDQSDLHDQLFREDALTDTFGKVRLSNQLTNLPWLQVWVSKMPLCQSNPRKTSFSVELIRRDGLSAPNLCGPVSAENSPGVFTVFVKNRAKTLHKGVSITLGLPWMQAPKTAPAAPSAVEAASPIVSPPPTPAATVAAPAAAPGEAAAKASPITPPATPAPNLSAANTPAVVPAKTAAPPHVRRVIAKRTTHRTKPTPPACSAQPPAAKPAHAARSESDAHPPRKTVVSATRHSKPLAGVRLAVKTPTHRSAHRKQ